MLFEPSSTPPASDCISFPSSRILTSEGESSASFATTGTPALTLAIPIPYLGETSYPDEHLEGHYADAENDKEAKDVKNDKESVDGQFGSFKLNDE
ncbi:hypothetical protein Syun_020703 [Stephania yunnanensis]|uniref:Uncharacterized protein n=1 Tax=Stephania yunnanensis TaxID=152371 RepID=A0AAP0NRN9_9MAGN